MLLYENNIARVLLDRNVPCLVFKWKEGKYSRTEFRDAMAHWLSALYTLRIQVKTGGPLGVLIDNTYAHPIDLEDQDWLAENITPRQLEAGLRFVAIIQGQSRASQINVANWRIRVAIDHQPFVTQVFDDASSARSWLHEAVTGS